VKLVYTEQAIASLQECTDFFPPEMPSEKVNEIRDQILAKADKLLMNPYIGQEEEYLEHVGQSHRRIIEGIIKSFTKLLVMPFSSPIFLTVGKIPQR
jgi:hypothetical protein